MVMVAAFDRNKNAWGERVEIRIYGVDENTIEIQGDIAQEFVIDLWERLQSHYFAFSDGTVVHMIFHHDGWEIGKIADGSAEYAHAPAGTTLARNDVATLTGDLRWVLRGSEVVFSS